MTSPPASTAPHRPVFDYRTLRLLTGLIALSLPFVVSLVSTDELVSISASYYTEARDLFVGMLFVVSAFMVAYNGHSARQSRLSKVAGVAGFLMALLPTACDGCEKNAAAILHYVAAAVVFSILAYFCLGPFRRDTQGRGGKKALRAKIYWLCGWAMILCMVGEVAAELLILAGVKPGFNVTYWAEAIALVAFGVAWIVSGKHFGLFADPDESPLKTPWL